VPTVYDILGVTPPEVYRGYEQMPVTGTSLAYSFVDAGAPSRKTVQYFEMVGHRAIYSNGWKAVTRHQMGTSFDDDRWELYHVAVDRSEVNDLAEVEPERLRSLIDLWWEEAEREGVLPLDDRGVELFGARFEDRTIHPSSRRYVYRPPMSPLPAQASAPIGGRSWDLSARVHRGSQDNGVIYASGTENSGISIFVHDGRLMFDYNCFGEHHVATSSKPVPEGDSVVGIEFRRLGRNGVVRLLIDGQQCGEVEVPFVMRTMSSVGPSVGYDHGSPVAQAYGNRKDGYPFSGDLEYVEIQLVSPTAEAEKELRASEERSAMGRQ
jgi:arylsulfatase